LMAACTTAGLRCRIRRRPWKAVGRPSFPSVRSAVALATALATDSMVAPPMAAKMLLGVKAVDVRQIRRPRPLSLLAQAPISNARRLIGPTARIALGRVLGVQVAIGSTCMGAIRGTSQTPRINDPWITSHLDCARRRQCCRLTAGSYPLGNARVNIGVARLAYVESAWPMRRCGL